MGELPVSLVTEGGTLEFRKAGETVDLVLGPALLDQLGLKAGDTLHVVDGRSAGQAASDRHDRVMDAAERMMTKYEKTLRALAR